MLKKATFLGFALVAFAGLAGCSGDSGSSAENAIASTDFNAAGSVGMHVSPEEVAEKLGLTEEQQASLKAIREKFAIQRDGIRASFDENTTREERREPMRAVREQMKAELKAILTEEQMTKMWEFRSENRKTRHQNFKPAERTERRVEHLTELLDLSSEQQDALKTAMTEISERFNSQMESGFNPEIMSEMRDEMHEAVSGILTADQLEQLEQFHKSKGNKGRGFGRMKSQTM